MTAAPSADLLIEIGTEELPARFVPPALEALRDRTLRLLDDARVGHGPARTLGTPRRLVLVVEAVEAAGATEQARVTGPPARIAFDEEGQPTKAALGFARKQGIEPGSLIRIETDKGSYAAADVTRVGARTAELLAREGAALVLGLPFAKTMRWGDPEVSFGRPIQWLLALLGTEPVDWTVGPVRSGTTTRPHRFHADPAPIEVDGVDAYLRALAGGGVMVDPAARREHIAAAVAEATPGLAAFPGADCDALVDEVTHLVEWPSVTRGGFDEEFLAVPGEVLYSAMRAHQRYFPVVGDDGGLRAEFVVVTNVPPASWNPTTERTVRAGNERVLRARLSDARYFWDLDRRTPLADLVEELRGVVYHRKLGSSHAKVERTRALAAAVQAVIGEGDAAALDRAALLCKADLVTEMVGEFPDLQGVMGEHYARHAGEPPAVAAAIREHYLPRFAGDDGPAGVEGALLGLADRLDTIAGSFAIGEVPSGAADPFGLRRRALAILSITLDRGWRYDLGALVARALEGVAEAATRPLDEVRGEMLAFFGGRLAGMLRAEGVSPDAVEAALGVGLTDVTDAVARGRAIAAWRSRADAADLFLAMRRVANILKGQSPPPLEPAALVEPSEKRLLDELRSRSPRVAEAAARGDYDDAIDELGALKAPLDAFFDDVLVMAEDPALRDARLGLLRELERNFRTLGDLTRVQLEGG